MICNNHVPISVGHPVVGMVWWWYVGCGWCGTCGSGMDARLLDAEPDSSVSGRVGAGLSSLRNTSRDAASVRGGKEHQSQM